METVTTVELLEDKAGIVVAARVHYTTGKKQDFKREPEISDLANFLKSHKAS